MRVYISGPITGHDDYREKFAEAEKQLTAAGHIAVNPAKMNEILPDGEHEEYMRLDKVLLGLCDAIYMLSGWKQSRGATLERDKALLWDMTILEE